MKTLVACALVIIGAAHTFAQSTNTAPLFLSINGGGSVSPLTNGEVLEVGQSYTMVATPDPGFTFDSWQPANVFTFTTYTVDATGNTITTNISVVPSVLPIFTNQPVLDFVMQPVVVILNSPTSTITRGSGWVANFAPILLLSIQVSDSAVILSWTNSSCSLQVASTPDGVYTNIPGAVSPFTNSISGPSQFFRLISSETPLVYRCGFQATPSGGQSHLLLTQNCALRVVAIHGF